MTAEERIFSIVRGGLYAKLPSLALPLGRLTCRAGDVDWIGLRFCEHTSFACH